MSKTLLEQDGENKLNKTTVQKPNMNETRRQSSVLLPGLSMSPLNQKDYSINDDSEIVFNDIEVENDA